VRLIIKKAATPGKGRAKKLTAVAKKKIPSTIPKWSDRSELKKAGRVVELGIYWSMTSN